MVGCFSEYFKILLKFKINKNFFYIKALMQRLHLTSKTNFSYYASVKLLSLCATFRMFFSILVALSLLPTYTLSFSLFGGDWRFTILGLKTFSVRTLGMAIMRRRGHMYL